MTMQQGFLTVFIVVVVQVCSSFQLYVPLQNQHVSFLKQHQQQFHSRTVSSSLLSLSSTIDDITEQNDVDIDSVVDVEFQSEVMTMKQKCSNVIDLAQEIRNKYGYSFNPLLIPRSTQKELLQQITELENDFITSSSSMSKEEIIDALIGDWDLIGTMPVLNTNNNNQQNVESNRVPSLFENEFIQSTFPSTLPVASLTNKFVTITQRIKKNYDNDSINTSSINRVDHIIQIKPPNQLNEVIDTTTISNNGNEAIASFLNNFNINPFEIKESKVILVHDAEIITDKGSSTNEIETSAFSITEDSDDDGMVQIRLNLKSIINNIAGGSNNNKNSFGNFLKPEGSDILSLNVPQLNDALKKNDVIQRLNDAIGGSFTTTYVDSDYRISRSTLVPSLKNNDINSNSALLQQIRIFRKRDTTKLQNYSTTDVDDIAMESNEYNDDGTASDVDDIAVEPPSDVE